MARQIDYTALSDLQLINAINAARPADAAVREMTARSGGGSDLQYDVIFVRRESSKLRRPVVKIKSICGPGDDAEPMITLMLPEED